MASGTRRADRPAIPDFRFAGTWRGYQQRLLGALHTHLDDRRLHVVAAPGAGKTVIGLEVLRQLGRPALILSPTLAIREQWLDRLRAMFAADDPAWLAGAGADLAQPGWLVSSTYQSLHAALGGRDRGSEDEDAEEAEPEEGPVTGAAQARVSDLAGRLRRAGIATLVLDEAHHLRRAWWESLQTLIGALQDGQPDFHIVSLTATPPYDVEEAEWERYDAICGPMDAEISIPELVRQGDLCPHQDFVHFSLPRPAEIGAFETFAAEVAALAGRWTDDPALGGWVRGHPWLTLPQEHVAAMLDRPALTGALLALAEAQQVERLANAYEAIGARPGSAPEPTARGLTPLLQALLDGDAGAEVPADMQGRLAAELRAIGGLYRGRLRLEKDEALARALTRSAGKLDSAVAIAQAELAALGPALRLVILTDTIRAEALRRPEDSSSDRLGAGPVFRRLVSAGLAAAMDAALVTGSVMLVPAAAVPALRAEATRRGLEDGMLELSPQPGLEGWQQFDIAGPRRAARLQIVTRLFETGTLRCLVGTAALLGEGWDAPSINSLVLATSVKTYMLSNQMRGRAIRRDPAQPGKTAAIWHLATIIPPDLALAREERAGWERLAAALPHADARGVLDLQPSLLGRDARQLAHRFRAFAGVTHEQPYRIRSGIGRLGVDEQRWTPAAVDGINRRMLAGAGDRPAIAAAWSQAVGSPDRPLRSERPRAGVTAVPPADALSYIWSRGLLAALAPLAVWAAYALELYQWTAGLLGTAGAMGIGAAILAVGLGVNARRLWRMVSAGSPQRHLAEIGECVLDGLDAAGRLHTPRDALLVFVFAADDEGGLHCSVNGGTQHDEAAFAEAFAELLEPIRNPRHILVRSAGTWPLRRVDYHAVPTAISAEPAAVEALERGWRRRIGPCAIHGTRSSAGRPLLLKARARQYVEIFVPRAERLTVWE